MNIYIKTSRHRQAATLAIDSEAFKELQDEYWPLTEDVQTDRERYWKFKLALRESCDHITTPTPPQLTLVLTRDRTVNNNEIDRMVYAAEFDYHCREIGAEPVDNSCAAFQSFHGKPNDHILYSTRLTILLADDDAEPFLQELNDLLDKYSRNASSLPVDNDTTTVGIEKLINEME